MGRLLVIDDSPTIRKVVELTFRGTTFTVDYAGSGRDGLAAAMHGAPDVILLDFVLPDMRGLDVCARLAADARTRDVPVLLMSAKDESVRALFKPYPRVVDFVHKPFTAEDLLARVRTAAADDEGNPRPSRAPARFTHAQKEAAAKGLYAKLSRGLALVPGWCAQLGTAQPAPFLARKLLTPELLGELLEALVPVFREVLGGETRTPHEPDASLSGEVHAWPVSDLFTLLTASGRSGALELQQEGSRVVAWLRAGEVVLVTSHDPKDHARDAAGALEGVAADALAAAEAAQRATGKPAHVTLAEQGALPPACDLSGLLHRTSRRLLVEALDARGLRFAWREVPALPAYVDAYGRYVPLARSTLAFNPGAVPAAADTPQPPSLGEMALERARAHVAGAHGGWPPAEMVLDRARGFSDRIRGLRLDAPERKLLALVNGRITLREIAARASMTETDARRCAHVLTEVGLVGTTPGTRPVLIVEPDVDGFRRPLQSLLSQRADPLSLVSLDRDDDLVAAALREHPSLVIVNASAAPSAEEVPRALRHHQRLASVPLVALLELPGASRAPALEAAGFDAVLVKPVAYADLERLIAI